jgi:type II secretory pathway pseudopilin PulG
VTVSAIPDRGKHGFTILEILIGICVLAFSFFALSGYSSFQRLGLNKASQLAAGTQVAASALEATKLQLADSLTFRSLFDQSAIYPKVITRQSTVNHVAYTVRLTLEHAQSPLYALKIRALASWGNAHRVELGVLFPGAGETL